MSDDQFLDGALDVCSYAARGMGESARNIGRDTKQLASASCTLVESVCKFGGCAVGLVRSIFG